VDVLETGSCRPSAYRQTRFWELAAAIVGTFVMARLDRGPHGDVRLRAAIGVVLAILVRLAFVRPKGYTDDRKEFAARDSRLSSGDTQNRPSVDT
jgi:hypothetical protein